MTVKQPRMTQMSWADTREALSQLFNNCEALKEAINAEVVRGKLTCVLTPTYDIQTDRTISSLEQRLERIEVASQAVLTASFWGRLKWLLTGRVA